MMPAAYIPTIRSRLRRKGDLRVRTLGPDSFLVRTTDGDHVTGPLSLQDLEQWSWDHTRGNSHE
jgi:hypothetical protein